METPSQTCARLVAALEDLVTQEAATLEARDFATVARLQARCAPLVDHLAAHSAEVTDTALRERIRAVFARRQKTGEWLAGQIEKTKQALQETNDSQRRVAQIAPVYGRGTVPASRQLCVVG